MFRRSVDGNGQREIEFFMASVPSIEYRRIFNFGITTENTPDQD